MSKPIGSEIPEAAVAWLVGGNPVAVATVDADGSPYGGILGSCVALDRKTLRFAAFGAGQTVRNVRAHGRIFIETLGDGLVIGMAGAARVVKDPMDASAYPPHHYVMVEVAVERVKDDHPPGIRITGMSYDYANSRQPGERKKRRSEITDELLSHPRGT